jgi:hypothetical protein
MTLTRYGTKEWAIMTVVAVAAAAPLVHFHIWWGVAIVAVLWAGGVAFFRDPWGRHPASSDPNDMVSPADGKQL